MVKGRSRGGGYQLYIYICTYIINIYIYIYIYRLLFSSVSLDTIRATVALRGKAGIHGCWGSTDNAEMNGFQILAKVISFQQKLI